MSSQVCSRCRKRKIRCDLQLPACRNCRLADAECLFWEEALGKEIPCSYVHSLQQRVASLQLEIKNATDKAPATSTSLRGRDNLISAHAPEQGYHSNVVGYNDVPSPSRTSYLGPGSSARLLERLTKSAVQWHSVNNIQLPKNLLPDEASVMIRSQQLQGLWPVDMTHDQRAELHSLVPPSTQRAIIENYLDKVSPEYSLFSDEADSKLLAYENPLRWSSSNPTSPSAFAIAIVFAISTALISRDLDSNLAAISKRFREKVQIISQRTASSGDRIETAKETCAALCALAICELINPVSNQLWDLLGRAVSTMEHLREGYRLRGLSLDREFLELELSLLKLESFATLHFRRPSQFCEMRLKTIIGNLDGHKQLLEELNILPYLHAIAQKLRDVPDPSERLLEELVPLPLRIYSTTSDISIALATVYTALHPLFTASETFWNRIFDDALPGLLQLIAYSSLTIIDHVGRLNANNKVLSVWMTAERVLEFGAI
ncbi:uncharacterized protein LY89DRAFT_687518 [Mollisia scopiformis]|uniref:Zn(2)-C6 fungal-type domain-containing protein n=1 Tax=Mollisia scopiformis TaxID=149040 RepID=A0A194X0I9_MOLSC|nr:uncharacterized protein LY89DRAFT_687518 [Mollisia scopiformis]KUJ13382.1 hypothetical protein LY89DRAFT_687518 [Mollisia scopiformis]